MSDIYKNEQRIYVEKTKPKRRRRSSRRAVFDDDGNRKRRSRNTGLRRFLHLLRKEENESKVWWAALFLLVSFLSVVAIWQFLIREHSIREDTARNEKYSPFKLDGESVDSIPE